MHRESPVGFLNREDTEEKSQSHGSQHYRPLFEDSALCLGPQAGMEEQEGEAYVGTGPYLRSAHRGNRGERVGLSSVGGRLGGWG